MFDLGIETDDEVEVLFPLSEIKPAAIKGPLV
jgi:hypothetical protein